MPDETEATLPDIVTRLRDRATRRRELAENANNYYHNYQRQQRPWNEPMDRSDYAQTLSDCRDLEAGADDIDRLRALIKRAWTHRGYRDCGYDQMTSEQKALYDSIIRNSKDV